VKQLIAILLFAFSLQAKNFSVANYNVQNLFDLHRSGHEYIDYIPFTKAQWNDKNYHIKLKHLARAIHDLKADIIALQEIESEKALKDLKAALRRAGTPYHYQAIATIKKTTVRTALLSKFPISQTKEIIVNPYDGIRSILDVTVDIKGRPFRVFVNHWKSKRGPESKRIPYGKALYELTKKMDKKADYLIIGDLNSNYNELNTFKKSQRHNDTKGVTAINHFLKTAHKKTINSMNYFKKAKERIHYDLWMELPYKQRWSYLFRGRNSTLDHIIIPKSLIDKRGINYKKGSFKRFTPPYLVKGRKIFRWKFSRKGGIKHHIGQGYSDHLPIIATFSY
jgi:predicted extracellular nuclease